MLRVRMDVASYRLPRPTIPQKGALVACPTADEWMNGGVRCFRPDRIRDETRPKTNLP